MFLAPLLFFYFDLVWYTSNMQKIIVILGATATKKTTLAKKIAKDFDAIVINADSFQVYQELNIGINKPNQDDIINTPIKLIDCFSIYDEFDVAIYQKLCYELIEKITKTTNKKIIICGGSNLYIDAVIKGYDLTKVSSRLANNFFDSWTYEAIYNYVLQHDPIEAQKIGFNNKQRIIRAAQIIKELQQPKSSIPKQNDQYIYDCLIIETYLPRQILYQKINQRVIDMIDNGWVQEVENLYQKDSNVGKLQAFKALGYLEILSSIVNHKNVPLEQIQKKVRNYAKRQLTWNKNKYHNQQLKFNVLTDDYLKLQKSIQNFFQKNKKVL